VNLCITGYIAYTICTCTAELMVGKAVDRSGLEVIW
jgi:hypothetical protein